MAQTLGQQLDEVQASITKTLTSQSYQNGDKQNSRAALFRLENREETLLAKIELYGRDYIPGQNTRPTSMQASVQFS